MHVDLAQLVAAVVVAILAVVGVGLAWEDRRP